MTKKNRKIFTMRYNMELIFAVYSERARLEAENLYLIGQIANLVS